MNTLPSPTRTLRRLRILPFFLLSLLLPCFTGRVAAQGAAGAGLETEETAPVRGQKVIDLRQWIDGLELANWRQVADLLVELTPNEDGSASLEVAEVPRPRLLNVPNASGSPPTAWRLPDGSRLIFFVDYYGRVQEVACAVPETLRHRPVHLGIFRVFEDEVECFVRAAL
jgi:hypothetical protein